MAAPRCTRFVFGSVRGIHITTPRTFPQTFSRSKSSRARNDDDELREPKGAVDKAPKENMTLEEQLEDMGVNEEEYKQLWRSMQEVTKKQKEWEPLTQEDAKRKWKKMRNSPDHLTLLHMYKHQGIEAIKLAKERGIELPGGEKPPADPKIQKELDALRKPLNIRAVNLRPLRRSPQHGIPVCDLQLRTYSIRNMEFFADFAMRAAYYMGLPARGPIPLPRITERWTVPRANFIFKKSQENFERITMRRLIQIQDGHPDVVKAWLAFLSKYQYHGIGMKANIWEFESLEDATQVGKPVKEGDYEGRREGPMLEKVNEILGGQGFKEAMKDFKSPVELRA
ncbi:30S ribosomal protein-like protein S10 [Lindgomyces ingoldianus]|uniref:30S ribosomal protein-like protein S10 n=1 Tax=Lindgomyces ingoldianus TaxID=673940 RepID=A0ACB6R6X8_9PLEO|nr:30S ribosomal protein-like protein S10 [Lindgomyces ingoldianus]KAF2474067.1 30S ribosomal protein-like protein S10 [Lindgomyces ingoldianus]